MDLAYAYANARVKAMHSKLFDRDRMRDIVDVASLAEVIELLEESPYKRSFVYCSTKYEGFELFKRALDDNLAWTMRKLLEISPGKARPLLSKLLKQWEINNLKKIIALKALGKPVAVSDLLPASDESEKFLAKVIAQPDLDALVKLLKDSEYAGALAKAIPEYGVSGDFRLFQAALDEYYNALLGRASREEKDPLVRQFLTRRIDFLNAMTILRLKKTNVAEARLQEYVVDAGNINIIKKMIETDADGVIALLRNRLHARVSDEAVAAFKERGQLADIEEELERELVATARKTLARSILSPGALLGYAYLKQEEVHALRKIAYATQFDVKQDIRQKVLARL